ncbi:MAG: FHA domain-containing protein [Anaerolineae bacterium]|nr:FHA domain-containing protein [Anaerolineae bacterium]
MSQSHPSAFSSDYSQDPQPQLQIVVHAGPLAGKGYPIRGDGISFGRDPENDISWDDSQVSRKHARLTRQDNELVLEDLGSTNGTLVNGKPIEGPHVLQPADIISIGSSIFGVKGFSAPNTLGVTQVSRDRMTLPPALSKAAASPPQPAPAPRPASAPVAQQSGGGQWNMVAIGGVAIFVVVVIALAAITAFFLVRGQETGATQVPTVVITAPVGGSEVQINVPVTVQATASDSSGVTRLELWVDGVKTAEAASPVAQGQPTLTASLQWVPTSLGNHTLEIRAYNASGNVSEPTAVIVNAVEDTAAAGSPTPTTTPETPTATVSTAPSLTALTDLNVRGGPETFYDLLGLLPSGTTAEIIGRDETRQWWQIRFAPSPTGLGWISADPGYSKTVNVDNVPIAVAPPTPTGTPTNTPTTTTTPTSLPTFTTVPPTVTDTPTDTPQPTNTPVQEGTKVDFEVSPNRITGGECVNVNWTVSGVREVYYQGQGVSGVGDRVECPAQTTTYRLRIIKQDGSEQVEDRTVEVSEPVHSAGRVTLEPDDTIDLDDGDIPGDDFKWNIDDDVRRFEARGDVKISIRGQRDSLNDISRDECRDASYGDYDFIDASDSIADPNNALRDGFAICYRTDDGRIGKLRFPRFSTGNLEIEWATWP